MVASKPIAALAPGTVISGKYRVEHSLGAGGMGVVVAARHLDLNTIVAIKVLLPSAASNEEATTRFVREGRAAAQLTSPHAAKVHDTGRLPSGEPYLVMELLRGRDLRAHLADVRRVPLGQATDWVLQATHALAEAHALKIIHRDVKPANLFLAETPNGQQIKVVDFGISKQLDAADAELTNTSSTVGTPRYMAPEQMRSSKFADVRGDIWSLGIVLYELTTGRNPFHGDSVTALCFDVMERTPARPSEMNPELPATFDDLVLKCLEKDPDDRFQSMDALAAALRPFARGSLSAARDSLRMGLFYAPPPASNRAPQPTNPTGPFGPVVGVTPLPAIPTPDPTAATKREGQGQHLSPAPHQPPELAPLHVSQQLVASQHLSQQISPQVLTMQGALQPFPQTMAFAPVPLQPELLPHETMRAWDTTAVPRHIAREERKKAPRLAIIAIGVSLGVSLALVGMLFAFRERPSPAAMPNSSSLPHVTTHPSTQPSSSQSSALPPEPIVIAVPPPTVSVSSQPASSPSGDATSTSTPSPTPSASSTPTIKVKPAVDCIREPTYVVNGHKYIKPECNR